MEQLDAAFAERLQAALAAAEQAGLGPRLGETYRTQARQDWLYAQGRTRSGPIVTHTRDSKHTIRLAADVYLYPVETGGKLTWEQAYYDRWGEIAEAQGLKWGGRFGSYDGPHVQAEWA
jgi:peptidoglycan LD-endopeptidase CwlK